MIKGRLKEITKIVKKHKLLSDRSPKNIRETLEELGPTFIKIGQILSTRVDLLGEEYIIELSKLRNGVEPLPFEEIRNILLEAYGNYDTVFSYVEEKPIGSASIAQVHKARLLSGEEIVLKIKRPNIDEEMKEDFRLFKECINMLHLNSIIKVIDLNLLIDELYKNTLDELDFVKEEKNIIEFSNKNADNSIISVPYVIDSLSRDNILAMEYIDGISINEVDKLRDNGYDLKSISRELCNNYVKQALNDGLFHADPHPDNILVRDDSIYFIDWGMVGRLSDKNKELLNDCAMAIVENDYAVVSEILIQMSTHTKEIDRERLIEDVRFLLNKYSSMELQEVRISVFAKEMFSLLRNNNLILNYDITMLIRGIGIIESVIKKLDSSANLVEVFENSVIDKELSVDLDKYRKIGKKIVNAADSLVQIPIETKEVVNKINKEDFKFKFEMSESKKHIDKIENLVHEVILGFLDGCLILGYSFIDDPNVQLIFLIAIVFISGLLIVKMLVDLVHHGY